MIQRVCDVQIRERDSVTVLRLGFVAYFQESCHTIGMTLNKELARRKVSY